MQQGIRRLLALAAVFAVAFSAVYLIRNGTEGITRLFDPNARSGQHRPEHATMAEQAPVALGDVELLAKMDSEQTKLMKAVFPSVVSIDTAGERSERLIDGWGREWGTRRVPTVGQGSGVIVSEEGHVVTNFHVIQGQREIRIKLSTGKQYPAKLIGQDQQLDVAVLKIDAKGEKFRPLKFGDSSQVQVCQLVFAIGNPFGFGESVTRGVISAVERSISDTQRDLFQTDAAINPGNSGGPLINVQGEIIGINSSIYTPDRANPGFQGVGFSIPSNDVKDALTAILERGQPIRGYLGLRMDQTRQGAVEVISVKPGSPAEAAGVKDGDMVLNYDGEQIESVKQLITRVQRTRIGRKVTLALSRDGKPLNVEATIAESEPEPEAAPQQGKARDDQEVLTAIGVQVRDLTQQERRLGFSGVVVVGVSTGGLALDRLKPGDLITAVNRYDVRTMGEFYRHLATSAGVQATSISYMREGKNARVDLPAVPRKEGE